MVNLPVKWVMAARKLTYPRGDGKFKQVSTQVGKAQSEATLAVFWLT
jgi:hypothetical protein